MSYSDYIRTQDKFIDNNFLEAYAMNNVKEASNFNLEEARKRVTEVTETIVNLFCKRQAIMRNLKHFKDTTGLL